MKMVSQNKKTVKAPYWNDVNPILEYLQQPLVLFGSHLIHLLLLHASAMGKQTVAVEGSGGLPY